MGDANQNSKMHESELNNRRFFLCPPSSYQLEKAMEEKVKLSTIYPNDQLESPILFTSELKQ